MPTLVDRDYFTDPSILRDPYAWFDALREQGRVYFHPGRNVAFVTGFQELTEVVNNTEDFSAINDVGAGAVPLPFVPEGPDISAQIEAHRSGFPGSNLLVAYDGQHHSFLRSLITRLFTPSRLKKNQLYIERIARDLIGKAVARGECNVIRDIATPIATLVIADLLGVPDDDRTVFANVIDAAPPPGSIDGERGFEPMIVMSRYFQQYVADRRANPRDDVISELANAKFPDGSTPDADEIVRLCVFLFGAGQDTSVKLLGNAMRYLIDEPGLQDQMRANPALVPDMLEEVLRLEGSAKSNARLARRDTKVGGVDIPAGTQVVVAFAAANRDPRRWDDPNTFRLGRPKIKEHLAFSRGAHVCAGAPLARLEVRVTFEIFLELTRHIDLDEGRHGPRGDRVFNYEPSFILRGLSDLHLKLEAGDR